ncbi:MAG: hypothetical protein OEX08_02545 [Candidatus Nomurabacteria bacterium]|nr:hypothetical protein [Candidatus Nomurabacteria bacterium]
MEKIDSMFIGVAGGSGVGKSTLCDASCMVYPEKIELIQLDDYFKHREVVPESGGMTNWDHPGAIDFNKLFSDLVALNRGESIEIATKNKRLNPDYETTKEKIMVVIEPRPIILVEGYLALYDKYVRSIMETKIWLELDHETRWSRRAHFKNDEYEKQILIPMHEQYVQPTRVFADHVLDVSSMSPGDVYRDVHKILGKFLN